MKQKPSTPDVEASISTEEYTVTCQPPHELLSDKISEQKDGADLIFEAILEERNSANKKCPCY